MTTNRIGFMRGDTAVFSFAVTVDGAIADLTGAAIFLTIKAKYSDADSAKILQKTIGAGITVISAALGTFSVKFDPPDTNTLSVITTYVWDVQLKLADNSIITPDGLSGIFALSPDVYNAIT